MTALNFLGGPYDLLILAVVALILFGGTKMAGFGKNAGKAIRAFKEETKTLSQPTQEVTPAANTVAVADLVEPRPVVEQTPENQA